MGKPYQRPQAALHHLMGRRFAQLRDETHAAGIMVEREGWATFRHITCVIGKVAKVQS
jgi:hypothetical protein